MSSLLKTTSYLALLLLGLFTYSAIFSSEQTTVAAPNPSYVVSGEPGAVSATAYLVFDSENGEVLAAKNPDTVLPIASVTKLFTATALVENTDLSLVGTVTTGDVATLGEAGRLKAGDSYPYRELLFPLLLESSNDAAAFFERQTSGQVIKDMNALTKRLSLPATTFADASGLSDENFSTASDLKTFLMYLTREQPYVLDISRLRQYVGPHTGSLNNSPLKDEFYKGGKHGYTTAAKRTGVALFEHSFGTEKRTLGYVLLGSDDLAADRAVLEQFISQEVTFQ